MSKRRKRRGRGSVVSAPDYKAQFERLKDESGLVGFTETPWAERKAKLSSDTLATNNLHSRLEQPEPSDPRSITSIDVDDADNHAEHIPANTRNTYVRVPRITSTIEAESEASQQQARTLKEASKFVQCIFCGEKVLSHKLNDHISSNHRQQSSQQLERPVEKPNSSPLSPKHDTTHEALIRMALNDVPLSQTQRQKYGKTMTTCPICNQQVRYDRLAKHLTRAHPNQDKLFQKKSQKPNNSSVLSLDSNADAFKDESLDQAYYDKQFADKYLGVYRRESSGRFGSIPLYDDYGDEADSE